MRFMDTLTSVIPARLTSVSYSCTSGDGALSEDKMRFKEDTLHLSIAGCSAGSVRFSQGEDGKVFTYISHDQITRMIDDLIELRNCSLDYQYIGSAPLIPRNL